MRTPAQGNTFFYSIVQSHAEEDTAKAVHGTAWREGRKAFCARKFWQI